jgi:peptidoglycan/LPS O-acetylase OafA/YrhL
VSTSASQTISPVTRKPHLTTSSQRIPELDGLRGLAILLVVLHHYTMFSRGSLESFFPGKILRVFGFGWSGVDLFFVLSGFLIGGILLEARKSNRYFKTFYARRIYRICPIYYLWLLLYLSVLVGGVFLAKSSEVFRTEDLVRFPRYLFFLQNFFYSNSSLEQTWLLPTWSLAVEEQYYLVVPLLIRFLPIRILTKFLLATVLIAPLLRALVHSYVPHGTVFASILMPCRADNLALGMLGAIAVRSNSFPEFLRVHPHFLSRTVLLLGTGVVCFMPWYFRPGSEFTLTIGLSWLAAFWLSLLLLVFYHPSGVIGRIMRLPFLRLSGTLSYCIYLIHVAMVEIAHRLMCHDVPRLDSWKGLFATLFAALATWLIAGLSWRYFEKPLLRRGHRYSY